MNFTAEQRAALTAKLGKPAGTPDDDILSALLADYDAQGADLTTVHAKAKSAEGQVTTLSAKVTALESERDAAKADVLRLSANRPADTDPFIIRDRAASSASLIDAMVAAGDMPQFVAEKIKPAIVADKDGKGGTAAALMLSAAPALGGERPIDFTLGLFKGSGLGIKHKNAIERGEAVPIPPPSAGDGQSNGGAFDIKEEIEAAHAYRDAQLTARGYQPVAGAAK